MKKPEAGTYASVWDAIADTPEEAANLRVRSELMEQIAGIVKQSGWTQVEAAARCGVTLPCINDLLRGRIARFSLDALVNIAAALGRCVHAVLRPAVPVHALPKSGFGMVKVAGPAVPPDFDVASLLKSEPGKPFKKACKPGARK